MSVKLITLDGKLLCEDITGSTKKLITQPPYIGELIGGGIVVYVGTSHILICSLSNISTYPSGTKWGNSNLIFSGIYPSPGSQSGDFFMGIWNCNTIVSNEGYSNAAGLCLNFNLNGYDDWCLPTLSDIYEIQRQYNLFTNVPTGYYWTSNERDIDESWGVQLSDTPGTRTYIPKSYLASVRPVRYIAI